MTDHQISELLQALRQCLRLYQQIVQRELKSSDLTFVQIQVIRILKQNGPLSLREVSEQLNSSMSSLSGVIDRLEKMDLVSRSRDHKDRRVIWIDITEKCRMLIKKFPVNQANLFRKYMGDMSEKDVIQLTQKLQQLAKNLEQGVIDE